MKKSRRVVETDTKEIIYEDEEVKLHKITLTGGILSAMQLSWNGRLITIWKDGQVNAVGQLGETGFYIR